MNGRVVEKCNHLADAIGKIDEAIEQIELLNISVKKQRVDVLSVASKCEELCAQIKVGEFLFLCNENILHPPGIFALHSKAMLHSTMAV